MSDEQVSPDGYIEFTLRGRMPILYTHYDIDGDGITTLAEALEVEKEGLSQGAILPEDLLDRTDIIEVELKAVDPK